MKKYRVGIQVGPRYFNTITEALKVYKISSSMFYKRIKDGMSPEEALTTQLTYGETAITLFGVTYQSVMVACEHFNIGYCAYTTRIHRGMTPEDAVTIVIVKNIKSIEVFGKHFNNMVDVARYYKIKSPTLAQRLKKGMTLEEAISKPVAYKHGRHGTEVKYRGEEFSSVAHFGEYYGVSSQGLHYRVCAKNMTITEAMDDMLAKRNSKK